MPFAIYTRKKSKYINKIITIIIIYLNVNVTYRYAKFLSFRHLRDNLQLYFNLLSVIANRDQGLHTSVDGDGNVHKSANDFINQTCNLRMT